MKALVLGFGISGKSAASFLEQRGYEVVVSDDRIAPKAIEKIEVFDLFVPSPGIPSSHPLALRAREAEIPTKGEVQLGLEATSIPCIGVTGTNGKTTVVEMITHGLNRAGVRAKAVGNVGQPITASIGAELDVFVVELSSFQLASLEGRFFELGLFLNIAEDHLDWHGSFAEYAKAKARLGLCIKEGGEFYVHESVSRSICAEGKRYFGQNEEAASLACQHFQVEGVFEDFQRGMHRLEFVEEVEGISFINDSKATNISAVQYALEQLKKKGILLLGGKDKGLSFAPLLENRDRIQMVIAFGDAREKIANQLKMGVAVHTAPDLEQAVAKARVLASFGDVVLFSPGCASFDAFQNYLERGEAFKRYVRKEKK